MSTPDNPGAAVRPPRLYLGALAAGMVLDYAMPLAGAMPWPARLFGVVPLAGGIALMAWAMRRFAAAGTNVPTVRPSTAVVTDDPYRFTRNPIYVGMTMIYLGIAALASSYWAMLFLVPALVVMQVGVIRREERYLSAKFGDPYLTYSRQVRRWF